MPLHLKIVSEHSDLLGDDAEREFGESGGTIGRSLENDWVLQDPERYVSGRHATIDFKAGMFYLLDNSSNGVYINDEVEPVGKGNSRRIFAGDSIRMGNFEFATVIDSGESIEVPLDTEVTEAPDNSTQHMDEASHNSDLHMLDEEALTGDDEFHNTLFGSSDDKAKISKTKPAANDESSAPRRVPQRPTITATPANNDEFFAAFMDGLGIDLESLHPSTDKAAVMETAGNTLRGLVEGIVSLLASRASLKNAFRLDQTTLLPRQNNPLKFSENSDDLLKQLLLGSEGDYLGASDAVREVCQDLLNHQNAFLDAMNAAFIEFSDRFAPEELEEGFNRTMTVFSQLPMVRKAKYWDLYGELYPIMTEKGGGRFPQMFGEEFVRAYERQIAEYRRHDRGVQDKPKAAAPVIDPGLLETRKLDQSQIGQVDSTVQKPASTNDAEAGTKADQDQTVEIRPGGRKIEA